MATSAQERQRQRQRARAQRQRERTRRRATRKKEKTRRIEIRNETRQTKIEQKGKSGYWSPEGITARGDLALGAIDRGIDIGRMSEIGNLIPDSTSRRDAVQDLFSDASFGSSASGGGSGGGNGSIETYKEETPIWQNPMVIGGVVVGGFLLYTMSKKK